MRTDIDYRKKENIMHPKNVWLHEDLSDLAKATCPEEELLSLDPDVLLYDYAIDFWMKDIVSRQGEVDRRLYDIAMELEFANNFQIDQHPDILDMFVSLRQHFGHVYTIPDRYATRLQTEEDKLQAIQHAWQFDFEITVKEPYVDDLVQRLMNYPPTKVGWVSCFTEGGIPGVLDSSSPRSKTLSVYFTIHPNGISFKY